MHGAPNPAEPSDFAHAAAPRRARGFSLIALIWLLTVAALGIGLYRAGKDVVPLRESIARLRKEIGYFPVTDELQTHVRRVHVKIPTAWQWRVFLPESPAFAMRYFLGSAPDPAMVGEEKWFAMIRAQSRRLDESLDAGEFGYEALITEYDGRPWLRAGKLAEQGRTVALDGSSEWLVDETAWVVSSDASYESVKSFAADRSVMLLHIERSIHADGEDDGESSDATTGGAPKRECFVLWLDSPPPAAPTPVVPGLVR